MSNERLGDDKRPHIAMAAPGQENRIYFIIRGSYRIAKRKYVAEGVEGNARWGKKVPKRTLYNFLLN